MNTLLNLTPDSILIANNQVYLADSFMTQYVNILLLIAIVCMVGGFGTALLMNDIIKPWLQFKLLDYWESNDYFVYKKNTEQTE